MQTSNEPEEVPNWYRLHPAMLLLGTANTLSRYAIPILFGAVVTGRGFMVMAPYVAAAVMISLVFQVMRFYSYRYTYGDGKIMIQEGILSRKVRTILTRRIHNLNTSQALLARLLGVVRLDIETAGGDQAEASMPAISKEAAETLSAYVRTARGEHDDKEAPKTTDPMTELHLCSPWEIILAGATNNRIGVIALGFIALGNYMELTSQDMVPTWMVDWFQDAANSPSENLFLLAIITFLVLFLGAWLFSIGYALVRWYGFRLRLDDDDLKINTGLFTLREYTIPREKIQALSCKTTSFRRPFGLFQIQVHSAGHVGVQEQSRIESDLLVPITHRTQVGTFARYAFPRSNWDDVHWNGVNVFTRSRQWLWMMVGITLMVLAAKQFYPNPTIEGLLLPIWLLCLPLTFGIAHLNWRQTGFAHDRHFIYIKTGFLGLHFWVLPLTCIQNLAIHQTPAQRYRNLATLVVDVAGLSNAQEASIPNIPIMEAWRLFQLLGVPRAA